MRSASHRKSSIHKDNQPIPSKSPHSTARRTMRAAVLDAAARTCIASRTTTAHRCCRCRLPPALSCTRARQAGRQAEHLAVIGSSGISEGKRTLSTTRCARRRRQRGGRCCRCCCCSRSRRGWLPRRQTLLSVHFLTCRSSSRIVSHTTTQTLHVSASVVAMDSGGFCSRCCSGTCSVSFGNRPPRGSFRYHRCRRHHRRRGQRQ